MTDCEWRVCRNPLPMLELLRTSDRACPRKLRLFAVACSRRVWDRLDDLGRAAVELAEQYADDLTGPEELRAARLACKNAGDNAAWYAAASSPVVAARNAALSAQAGTDPAVEPGVQADLLRCIFGTPIRSRPCDQPRRGRVERRTVAKRGPGRLPGACLRPITRPGEAARTGRLCGRRAAGPSSRRWPPRSRLLVPGSGAAQD